MNRQQVAWIGGALCLVTAGGLFVAALLASPVAAIVAALAVILVVVGVEEIG